MDEDNADQISTPVHNNVWQIHLFNPIYISNLMRISTEVTLSLLPPDNHQFMKQLKIE